ncbi:MAG: hypothetical protein RIC07_22400 [Coleofasciculus sp. E1-EBD-02]
MIKRIRHVDDPRNYGEWVITWKKISGSSLIFLDIRHDVDIPVTEIQLFQPI